MPAAWLLHRHQFALGQARVGEMKGRFELLNVFGVEAFNVCIHDAERFPRRRFTAAD
jgi:hypothetical protein